MKLLFVDQSESKLHCIDLLDQLLADKDDPRYKQAAELTLEGIMGIAKAWNIDQEKLLALLRSQIFSGNIPGAIKVIKGGVPDQRIKTWVPVTGALLAVAGAWYIRSII